MSPKFRLSPRPVLLVLALLSAASGSGMAADKKEDKGQARQLKQMQQKMNALEQEKSQLDAKLKESDDRADKAEAAARRGAAQAVHKQKELEESLKAAQDNNAALTASLDDARKEAAAAKKTLADTQETLRQTEEAKRRLDMTLNMRSGALAACETKNESLYRTGGILLKKYQDKGCLDSFFGTEPVTQLGKANLENEVEELRVEIEQERVNQRQEEARERRRQQEEADRQALEKADREMEEQKRVEQEKLKKLKTRQQSDINRIGKKISEFFEGVEW